MLAGQDIDKIKNQKPRFDKDGRTVGFKFDVESDEEEKQDPDAKTPDPTATAKEAPEKSILANKGAASGSAAAKEESKEPQASGKSIKWFE